MAAIEKDIMVRTMSDPDLSRRFEILVSIPRHLCHHGLRSDH